MIHTQQVHCTACPSLFSQPSQARDYRGFVHLAILVLAVSLVRLAVENYQKYGILLSVPGSGIFISEWICACLVLLCIACHYAIALLIELKSAPVTKPVYPRRKMPATKANSVSSEANTMWRIANVFCAFVIAPAAVWTGVCHPGLGAILVSLSVICAMKITSFHAVMAESRRNVGDKEKIGKRTKLFESSPPAPTAAPNISSRGHAAIDSPLSGDGNCAQFSKRHSRRASEDANFLSATFPILRTEAVLHRRSISEVSGVGACCCGKKSEPLLDVQIANDEDAVPDADILFNTEWTLAARYVRFVFAPTLCYQHTYPQTPKIRPVFLLGMIAQLAIDLSAIHLLLDQYAVPTLRNATAPLMEGNLFGVLERLLKFSLSSLLLWLFTFHALFHCALNILAEITRFGDRTFYRAWWNSATVGEYWRLWNIPVHFWLRRHVFTPLVDRGLCAFIPCGKCRGTSSAKLSVADRVRHTPWTSSMSQAACFFLSAAVHEYIVAVPTHLLEGWAFLAMIIQIPVIFAERNLRRQASAKFDRSSYDGVGSTVGNLLFWLSFCIIGQPACILLYYRAWCFRTGV